MSQTNSKKRKTDTPTASTPTPVPTPTPAPAAPPNPYSAPQGSRTPQIPIDPALQQQQQQQNPTTQPTQPQVQPLPQPQQAQQQYANYYQQYSYPGYHPPPAWSAAQARAVPQPQPQANRGGELDTSDIATLNDAIGSAGVDLRAEEETLRQSHAPQTQVQPQTHPTRGRRAKKQGTKAAFDAAHLGTRMRDIAGRHTLANGVPEDSVTYLALALRVRLAGLIEGMAAAAAHREETGVLRAPGFYADGSTPMWTQVIRRDVAKQLALLERVEREEELAARRERKAYAAVGGGQTALPSLDDALPMEQTEEEPKKKKKKPDGPGVTAKNMSEDMKKKLSNAVAAQAAGLGTGKYAWMNAGNIPSGPPAKKAAGATGTTGTGQQSSSGWAKPFQSKKKDEAPMEEDSRRTVTLRDAIFVVERERGHGGGRGAARGWT